MEQSLLVASQANYQYDKRQDDNQLKEDVEPVIAFIFSCL